MSSEILFVLIPVLFIVDIALKIHGIILGFKKKWYIGLACIFVPFFALIVSLSKILLKKDILK